MRRRDILRPEVGLPEGFVPPSAALAPPVPPDTARRPDAESLLGAVASALTACEAEGIAVKLKHGIVMTREGYVLPVSGGWVARTRQWSPFSPDDDDEDG